MLSATALTPFTANARSAHALALSCEIICPSRPVIELAGDIEPCNRMTEIISPLGSANLFDINESGYLNIDISLLDVCATEIKVDECKCYVSFPGVLFRMFDT